MIIFCPNLSFLLQQPIVMIIHFYPPPDEVGAGFKVSPRLSVRPSVRISFPEQILETHGGDLFHFANTRPLGGVDVPFLALKKFDLLK